MKILYIHGYNGEATGKSYQNIKNVLPADYELIGVNYNEESCGKSLKSIRTAIEVVNPDVIIGSSLGGFLTLMQPTLKLKILINPCLNPGEELIKLGAEPEFAKHFHNMIADHDIAASNVCAVFGDHDNLFGNKYLNMFKKLNSNYVIVDSDHQISEAGAECIPNLISKYYDK